MKKYHITTFSKYSFKAEYIFFADRMTANKYSVTFHNVNYAGRKYVKYTFYKHYSLAINDIIVNVEKL